jgi:hypothetical protein
MQYIYGPMSARPLLQYYLTKEAELLLRLFLSLILFLKMDKGGDGEHIYIYDCGKLWS